MALSNAKVDDAISRLREECMTGDQESDHAQADEVLLDLIDSHELREVYESIPKWYA